MKKYNLNIVTGSPGDFREGIDWGKYKDLKTKVVNMDILVMEDPLLDSLVNTDRPTESIEIKFLKII